MRGRVTHPGYEHLAMDPLVDRVEPERLLSFSRRPNAVDPEGDGSGEPMTRVTIKTHDASRGTQVTVVETGLNRFPCASAPSRPA